MTLDVSPHTRNEFISALIAEDTTSSGSNMGACTLLYDAFTQAGAKVEIMEADDGIHANLLASFPDASGDIQGGVLLAGHSDCVPVTDQQWDSDPFQATIREGRLYGRGSADMKSYLAIAAYLAPEMGSHPLREPLHVAVTWDEETSCSGARLLVDALEERHIQPRIAIVGEPTGMRAIGAHKSMTMMEVTITGIAAHSSLPTRGVSAIRHAADFINWYEHEVIDEFMHHGPYDDGFVVPWSTGGVNAINAGVAVNTIPRTARLLVDLRTIPTVEPTAVVAAIRDKLATIETAMRAEIPDNADISGEGVGASLSVLNAVPALRSGSTSAAAQYAVSLGAIPSADKVTYGTEAGFYEDAGMSAVVLGPGDISQAHGANEYVELAQLDKFEDFLRRLIDDMSVKS